MYLEFVEPAGEYDTSKESLMKSLPRPQSQSIVGLLLSLESLLVFTRKRTLFLAQTSSSSYKQRTGQSHLLWAMNFKNGPVRLYAGDFGPLDMKAKLLKPVIVSRLKGIMEEENRRMSRLMNNKGSARLHEL